MASHLATCSYLTELVCLLCLNISKWKINGNKHQGLTRLKSHARTGMELDLRRVYLDGRRTSRCPGLQVWSPGLLQRYMALLVTQSFWASHFTGKLWSVGCVEVGLTQLHVYSDFERGFWLQSCISVVDVVLDAAQVPRLFCLMVWSRRLSLLHPLVIPAPGDFSLLSAWARLGCEGGELDVRRKRE